MTGSASSAIFSRLTFGMSFKTIVFNLGKDPAVMINLFALFMLLSLRVLQLENTKLVIALGQLAHLRNPTLDDSFARTALVASSPKVVPIFEMARITASAISAEEQKHGVSLLCDMLTIKNIRQEHHLIE
uniref:Uncharacterized protein n=1 Tax=Oryza nivara TaxID=4536 RepID=A0A0E0IZW7_ORYNI